MLRPTRLAGQSERVNVLARRSPVTGAAPRRCSEARQATRAGWTSDNPHGEEPGRGHGYTAGAARAGRDIGRWPMRRPDFHCRRAGRTADQGILWQRISRGLPQGRRARFRAWRAQDSRDQGGECRRDRCATRSDFWMVGRTNGCTLHEVGRPQTARIEAMSKLANEERKSMPSPLDQVEGVGAKSEVKTTQKKIGGGGCSPYRTCLHGQIPC